MGERRLLALARGHRMKRVLRRMLDETEFLSQYGVRALSRHHLDHPYTLELDGMHYTVQYQPAESNSGLFGGNSNWRGPIWFPVNYLIIESLQQFHHYYGDDFKVECPTGSGQLPDPERDRRRALRAAGQHLPARRARAAPGLRRPASSFQNDPHWRDHILFYEYFHGDNGAASARATRPAGPALVAKLLDTTGRWRGSERGMVSDLSGSRKAPRGS